LLRPQEVDLQPFIDELWEGVLVLGPRRFVLGSIPAGTLLVDPDRLAQALRNLVANAVAHTSAPDGLVRLSAIVIDAPAGGATAGRAGARQNGAVTGMSVRFVVDDDGPGIPADQRELIFGRFHRTDAARDRVSGGAGLGLSIVRAIAESHGGGVVATQSPEGGARVELELRGFTFSRAPHAPPHVAPADRTTP
jgi:signal transduction histidine kinase